MKRKAQRITQELIELAKQGDKAATEAILRATMPKINALSRYFEERLRPDMVQVGMLAAWRAIEQFTPDGGAQFQSYAKIGIWRAMNGHLYQMGSCVRYNGMAVTRSFRRGNPIKLRGLSLQHYVPAVDDDHTTFQDLLRSREERLIDDELIYQEKFRTIEKHLENLSERELKVFRIVAEEGWIPHEQREQFGVSRQMLDEIKHRAYKKIRFGIKKDNRRATVSV